MGKFHGAIGYGHTVEKDPGVWVEEITERSYFGDELKQMSKTRDGEHLNDNLTVDIRISIVADPYAYMNFSTIRYVAWMGTKWKVSSVDVQRPRLILTIGEVYNEQGTPTGTP